MPLSKIPRKQLGFYPTPLHPLPYLSQLLGGPEIWIKRDDQSGLGLGGNKVRKLEFILGDALRQQCDTIITAGAQQSNHCRQTAAAAASLGLECHLVLGGEAPSHKEGNILLDHLFGAHIHWCGKNRKGEDIPQISNTLTAEGKKVYVVPYGGTNTIGTCGYIDGIAELQQQSNEAKLSFDHIITASSSGATQAGMVLGAHFYNMEVQITGINIDKDETNDLPFAKRIYNLVHETAAFLKTTVPVSDRDIILSNDYLGEGYGIVGNLEKEAIILLAKSEGIVVDPVYTGRALGGLIDMVKSGRFCKNEKILFWHTGGVPALFAYKDIY